MRQISHLRCGTLSPPMINEGGLSAERISGTLSLRDTREALIIILFVNFAYLLIVNFNIC